MLLGWTAISVMGCYSKKLQETAAAVRCARHGASPSMQALGWMDCLFTVKIDGRTQALTLAGWKRQSTSRQEQTPAKEAATHGTKQQQKQ